MDLFDAISQFFDPVFLILAIVSGYFIFLLFFYGTEHWNKTEWGDRVFISLLIGLTLFFFFAEWVPITGLLWMSLMRKAFLSDSVIYSVSTFFFLILTIILSLVRSALEEPLHSEAAKRTWKGFFRRCRLTHLIKFNLFWLFFVILTTWQYPLSEFLVQKWMIIGLFLGIGSIFLYALLPFVLSNLTYIPRIKFQMLSDFVEDLEKASIRKTSRHLTHIAVLFLVALSVTNFDSQFGVFTAKIALRESIQVVGETVYLSRHGYSKPLVVSQNQMTLHMIPPLIPGISVTFLQIKNPSNFTSTTEYETKISNSDGLDCSLSSDEVTLNVLIETEEKKDLSVRMDYYDQLKTDSIVRIREDKDIPVTTLPNGTIVKDYYFEIANLSPYDLYLKSVDLLYLGAYNVTAFGYEVEWEPEAKGFCNVYTTNSWAHLHGEVAPNTSLSARIKVSFEEL